MFLALDALLRRELRRPSVRVGSFFALFSFLSVLSVGGVSFSCWCFYFCPPSTSEDGSRSEEAYEALECAKALDARQARGNLGTDHRQAKKLGQLEWQRYHWEKK
jgi:hypothetical protein